MPLSNPYQQNRLCNHLIAWLASGVVHAAFIVLCMAIASEDTWRPRDSESAIPVTARSPVVPLVAPAGGFSDPPPAVPEPPAPPPTPAPPKPTTPPKVLVEKPPTPSAKKTPAPQKKTREDSIRKRLDEARQNTAKTPDTTQTKPRTQTTSYDTRSLEKDLRKAGSTAATSGRTAPNSRSGKYANVSAQQQSADYAAMVVRPRIDALWTPPKLGDRRASPVQLEFYVDASGRVISSRILTRSDNRQMNDSAEQLLRTVRQFEPFSVLGLTEQQLRVAVYLELLSAP